MIDQVIRFSIKNKLVIGLFILLLISWGTFSLSRLPIDAVPDITDNQIQIITTSPSLATQEVEQLITFPLEMELGNLPKLEEIRSISRFGLSVITVVFEEEMDIYLARQLVGERLDAAKGKIPSTFGVPEMGPITTGLGEVYQYVVYPAPGFEAEFSPMELRSLQDWVIKRQLVGIKGVIEVNSSGGYLKQYEVAVNPEKLKSLQLSIGDIFEALERNNSNTGGSYIEKDQYTYFIRGEGLLKDVEAIKKVFIKHSDGIPILIRDVAEIKLGHAPRFGAVTMNGIGEVVAGQVMMLKGENAAAVTERVKERMVQIQASLPEGVLIEPYLDRTKLVNRTISTVATNLIEGGLIVIFVLVLLLGNIRAGLIVASVIPLSMLFAVSLMQLFGVSANLMSLGAIDFGLIVDGAVIIVEAIMHHLGIRQKKGALSASTMDEEVFIAASKTRKAAAFGEIIILMVYVPILFLAGIEGKMFRPMAQTVSFAILGALILSLTYVPMMSALWLKGSGNRASTFADRLMEGLYRLYRPVLEFGFRFKYLVLLGTLGAFLWCGYVLSRMGGEFIPTLEEGDFALHQILPPGSSIAQGVEVSDDLQRILLDNFPEVEKVVTKIGTAEIPTDIMPLEAGDIYVILKPKAEWTTAKTREGLFEAMEEKMNEFPGVIYEFTQPIQMRFNELMTGVRQDIAIKIYGDELGILAQKAKEAEGIIEGLDGVGDLQVEATGGLQQMMVNYDRSKVAKYGLSIEEINKIIRGGFAGAGAGYLFEEEKRFEIVVRLDEAYRENINNLQELYIPLSNGDQIPLSEVAEVRFEEGPTQISRDNTQRRITIGVNARGRDVESLVKEIERSLERDLELPPGYYISYGGQFENLQKATARLRLAVPLALLLIFFLLYITFRSVGQALIIFTAIPMSAIGGIIALQLRDMPFSISAGVGFIALFGVAVLNGIVLISYLNQLKKEGMIDIRTRIREGTKVRLRPVIMTATVASLGFFPMAFSTAAGAEVQRPLATVVIGGLLTATFLTLIILPILYFLLENGFRGAKSALMVLLIAGIPSIADAQPKAISVEEAISIGLTNHPNILFADQDIKQKEALSKGSLLAPRGNLYYSSEEYTFEENTGIHSFGYVQSFFLPGVNQSYRNWQKARLSQSAIQAQLSRHELERAIRGAYFQLSYLDQQLGLGEELLTEYKEFKRIAKWQYENGESGKIPLLTAETRLKAALLNISELEKERRVSSLSFNQLLFSDTIYTSQQTGFAKATELIDSTDIEQHPLIELSRSALEVAEGKFQLSKKQQLPQLQLGAQIQRVGGNFPFYGYQLGLNIPLFQKAFKAQTQSSLVEITKQKAGYDRQLSELRLQLNQLLEQYDQLKRSIDYLEDELMPLAKEQKELSLKAFKAGEITYLEYISVLESEYGFSLSYLKKLWEFQRLKADWIYLSK